MDRVVIALSLLVGCGGGTAEGTGTDPRPDETTEGDEPVEENAIPASASRALGLTGTYGDLVAAARALDDAGAGDATSGCLLGGVGPYRLEADLAVALRPMPDAAPDLDARLATVRSVRVLSRWGQLGPGGDLAAAAFTSSRPRPREGAVAWFLTDRGLWIRPVSGDASAGSAAGPLALREAAERATDARRAGIVVVIAEAGVALADLRAVLAALAEASANVALAVSLAEEIRLPDPARASLQAASTEGLCPSGLPALPDTQRGELSAEAIVGALGPLRDGAKACLESAQGEAAAGGRVVIAMRIGPDGALANACLVEDGIGDARMRACLLQAARATAFSAPSPAGSVDAVLPLDLRPETAQAQRPVCE